MLLKNVWNNVGVLIVRNVPASICNQCGEKFLYADVMKVLENIAVDAKRGTLNLRLLSLMMLPNWDGNLNEMRKNTVQK